MRAVVMHAPGDVRTDEIDRPTIVEPTDAIIRVTAACVCGSDLWPYRGIEDVHGPTPMGHEYIGVVEQIGDGVHEIEVGDFVVGSFVASDNTCEICQAGFQSRCVHQVMMGSVGTQADYAHPPRRRHPRQSRRPAHRGADKEPARSLRRPRHRLVRRRRR
jgi:threonine dehydrogenase-like Zn-dependent dehydrogenase